MVTAHRDHARPVVAIVQARMGSSRLPGKVLRPVLGRPLLDFMVQRMRRAKTLDGIVLATTDQTADDAIVRFGHDAKLSVFRGSEDDVLGRYYGAALAAGAATVVRLTSDCPIIDPAIIDLVVNYFCQHPDLDYCANTTPPPGTYPDGMDVEVFSFAALERSHREARLPSEREHVTFHMWRTGLMQTATVHQAIDQSSYRFTVDYDEDFRVIESILIDLGVGNPDFSMADAIAYMDARPDLRALQAGIVRNGGWNRAFDKDKAFALQAMATPQTHEGEPQA